MKKLFVLITVPLLILLTSCVAKNPETKTDTQTGETKTSTSTLSAEEEAFNNSGQAKAIVDETDLWQIYENKEVWFSFKYPTGTNLIKEQNYKIEPGESYIKVEIKEIGNPVAPNDLTKEQDMKNIEDLSAWKFWVNYDNPIAESKKVSPVWNMFWQDFLVLSRFDVCNVTVERMLVFYFNNKKILITSYAPLMWLKTTFPDYFMLDEENCQTETRWKFNKQAEFYQTLADKKAPAWLQIWYNNFDKIVWTITFNHK